MSGKIFISYRRDDAPGDARGARDGLVAKFGKSYVFMDVDNLLAGQRFDKELAKALSACDVLVAIMGPRWTEILKARIESEERDYSREEISAALKRGIIVIPVRIGREGHMLPLPRPADLPEDIRDLVLYQKHDIRHEHFGRDMAELCEVIMKVRGDGTIWTNTRHWIAVGGFAFISASAAAYYSGVFVSPTPKTVGESRGYVGQPLDFAKNEERPNTSRFTPEPQVSTKPQGISQTGGQISDQKGAVSKPTVDSTKNEERPNTNRFTPEPQVSTKPPPIPQTDGQISDQKRSISKPTSEARLQVADARFSMKVGAAVRADEYRLIRNIYSIENCANFCANDARCKVFSFWNNNICYLFDKSAQTYATAASQAGYKSND